MDDLLACPACGCGLTNALQCVDCGAHYAAPEDIPDLRIGDDPHTDVVRDFYTATPFPNYPPGATLAWLCARAERSAFAVALDAAIPGDARILEIGCGTGQTSLYLARADRQVIGADLTRASLRLAAAAAARFGLRGVRFVETDLHRPGLARGAFDIVYASGVLHHTPDPRAAFAQIVPLARPGGMIVIGLYNRFARLPLQARRLVARLTRFRMIPFDPVLGDRAAEPERRDAWVRDQYHHPEEHCFTIADVRHWFAENNVDYVRSYPSALLQSETDDLFAPEPDRWQFEEMLAQLGWTATLGHEGGLFVTVGRRS